MTVHRVYTSVILLSLMVLIISMGWKHVVFDQARYLSTVVVTVTDYIRHFNETHEIESHHYPTEIIVARIDDPEYRRQALVHVALARGIDGRELQQLLGHSSHETGRWEHMIEQGSDRYFKRYDPPTTVGKALGNTVVGDGPKYRGRGHLMLTGRLNYRLAGRELELPLEDNPDLMLDPYISAIVTVWWWENRIRPRTRIWTNTAYIAGLINPGNTDQRALNSRHRHVHEQGVELGLIARR